MSPDGALKVRLTSAGEVAVQRPAVPEKQILAMFPWKLEEKINVTCLASGAVLPLVVALTISIPFSLAWAVTAQRQSSAKIAFTKGNRRV